MKRPLLRFYMDNRKYLPGIALIIGLSCVSGILKIRSAVFWGQAVDYGTVGKIDGMLSAALWMGTFILTDCARTALQYYITGRVTENMFLEVRERAFEKVMRGDAEVLEKQFRTGDIAARLNGDIDSLGVFSASQLSGFSRQIFAGIFGLVGCIFLSWQISVAYLVILPLSLWGVTAISRPIQNQIKTSMDDTGAAMSTAAETISSVLTIKAFAAEGFLEERFDRAVDRAYERQVLSERLGMKMTGVKYLANVVQTMCLFLVGSFFVSSGRLSVGAFISFMALSNYITSFYEGMDYMLRQIRRASASAWRYYEVMDIPDEGEGTATEACGTVPCEAADVNFSYGASCSDSTTPALSGLSLLIPEGRKVAVVGASGCGKSTLVKLICRLYLPGEGSLKLFGVEAADWNPKALRERIAIVPQDAVLFDGSFYENVAYGNRTATRQDCEAALREVALWDFVSSFPEGMDRAIGEGGNSLSGGQKQRLCIARAIVKNAPLVLLDEATSALDFQTEREVQDALDKLLMNRTAVIIAHRLNTVQGADYVYCMDHGRVAEEGTPTELLARKGMYYEMYKSQRV